MKKRAALLTILLLLLLAGCRPQAAGEVVPPGPSDSGRPVQTPEQTAFPMPTATRPAESLPPEESVRPGDTDAPEMSESLPPQPTETGAQDYRALAEELCGRYQDSFSNGTWYALDRAYWFADYVPGQAVVDLGEGVDGSPLTQPDIYFYEDTAGTMDPEDAAAELVNIMLQSADPEGGWEIAAQILLDREALLEECAAYLEGYTGSWEDQNRVKSWFDGWAAEIPGIGTDMWVFRPSYTGGAASGENGGWFVIMREGNLYRMQRDDAFTAYVGRPEVQVRVQLSRALEAWSWFHGAPLSSDPSGAQTVDGTLWYPVTDTRFDTVLDLRMYLKGMFSDEIAESLLGLGVYRDLDGVLVCAQTDGSAPAVTDITLQVTRVSDVKLLCHMEAALSWADGARPAESLSLELPYEKVGERWVFTEFSLSE